MTERTWQPLGSISPHELTEARLELHWATQTLAAVGNTLVAAKSDDSHTSMEWLAGHRALASDGVRQAPHLRAFLRPHDLRLGILDADGHEKASLPLEGQSLAQALAWLRKALADLSGTSVPELSRPTYEMPQRPAGENAPFELHVSAYAELEKWFGNSDAVLRELASLIHQASPIRCWPHHFDIGTLIVLEPDKDPEQARSIGIGMEPGDTTYPQPYWYVNPYPQPSEPPSAVLANGGTWHREGFIGAILTGDSVVGVTTHPAQRDGVKAFLNSALAAIWPERGRVFDSK